MEILKPKVDHSQLVELSHMIKGTYSPTTKTKGASSVTTTESYPEIKVNDQLSRAAKLNELGKVIREYFGRLAKAANDYSITKYLFLNEFVCVYTYG